MNGNLLSAIYRGQSFARAWMNLRLGATTVDGLTVDLGTGGSHNFDLMRRSDSARVLTVDLWPEAGPDLVANLESPLPLASASVDNIMLLNVLEHIYGYEQLLCEAGRALRPGGRLILFVPFLYPVHTAQRGETFTADYLRWTDHALVNLLVGSAGFSGTIQVAALDLGPFTAAVSMITPLIRWGAPRAAVAWFALALDRFVRWVRGASHSKDTKWVIGYFVQATK
ncbi:MAG TPA: methyltransferase domain-containing protein [Armatimonadota bacterium]|nr:methyltransferase domain-containing protein [Armatimonadota bacterium]